MTREDNNTELRKREAYRVTITGTVGNLALLVFKFVAGILGHSAAMIADAVHSLSDFVSDIVVLVSIKISNKPDDEDHDYGHGKYETLATAVIAILLFIVGGGIMWRAAQEIIFWAHGGTLDAPGSIALIAALVSLAVKEALYQITMRVARKHDSPVLKANAWHHRSDALSSIGTTLGIAGAMFLGVKGRVLDPIAAAFVSVFIMIVAYRLLKPCLDELLEHSLPEDVENQILQIIEETPEVESPHHLRTRRIGNYAAVDVHVRMDPEMTVEQSHRITCVLEEKIRHLLGPRTYISIHVEPIKQG